MKTRIIVSTLLVALFTFFIVLNYNTASGNINADNISKTGCEFYVNLSGPGANMTTSSIQLVDIYTGTIYNGTYSSPGVYVVNCAPPGSYNVFACTNYYSHGVTYNVTVGKEGGSGNVSLSEGACTPVSE